ncbi:hypothetical protein FQA39_LY18228 [Lamprigera yunnana]|nr:hypothetical protein FQA39_LY18228 [Lamprigera yunnana]
MDADNKMSRVCRVCLEKTIDSNFIQLSDSTIEIKAQLKDCIPELDLDLIANSYLCMFCLQDLQNAYEFKQKCLQSEERIRKFLQKNYISDLTEITDDLDLCRNLYYTQHTDLGLEVIYIRDDNATEGSTEDNVRSFLEEGDKIAESKDADTKANPRMVTEELRLQSQVVYSSKKDVESFHCSKCDFKTSRSFLLKQHSLTHDIKPTEEKEEKKECTSPVIKPNGIKGYMCDQCPYKTVKKLNFQNHRLTHKRYACHICSFVCNHSGGFTCHLKTHGVKRSSLVNNDVKVPVVELKKRYSEPTNLFAEKNLKCDKCDYETGNLTTFQRHLSSHSKKEQGRSVHPVVKLEDKGKLVSCPECPFKVHKRQELKYHLTLHTGSRPFKCSRCTFNAAKVHHLNKHMLLHRPDY